MTHPLCLLTRTGVLQLFILFQRIDSPRCSSAIRLRFMRLLVGREAANIADTKSYSQTQTLHTAASPLADARR